MRAQGKLRACNLLRFVCFTSSRVLKRHVASSNDSRSAAERLASVRVLNRSQSSALRPPREEFLSRRLNASCSGVSPCCQCKTFKWKFLPTVKSLYKMDPDIERADAPVFGLQYRGRSPTGGSCAKSPQRRT